LHIFNIAFPSLPQGWIASRPPQLFSDYTGAGSASCILVTAVISHQQKGKVPKEHVRLKFFFVGICESKISLYVCRGTRTAPAQVNSTRFQVQGKGKISTSFTCL